LQQIAANRSTSCDLRFHRWPHLSMISMRFLSVSIAGLKPFKTLQSSRAPGFFNRISIIGSAHNRSSFRVWGCLYGIAGSCNDLESRLSL
jgi:hypothetical protein